MTLVQTYNPRTKQWVLIDKDKAKIVNVRKKKFNGIKIINERSDNGKS